ncbi:MAG: peptidoglycan DD-metalloendopeptidase family protein [Gammaproteobacteria bacterium]|nr:peptidoglycan DD-metalloendopeptidase family protein [Gammaproteobacteria bacterium]
MKILHFFLLTVFLVIADTTSAASSDDRFKKRQATEKELSELRAKIKQLQSNQTKKRSSLNKEQKALKKTDVLIGQSRKILESTRKKSKISHSRLKALKVQKKRLNRDKEAQQKALREQIRAAYAGGKQEYMKLIFNQEDPSKLGRTLVYYDYLNKARLEKIKALNTTLEKLAQVETEIIAEQQQLQKLENEHEQENTRLAALKSKRQKAISELNISLKNNSKQLKEWQMNEQDLTSLLEALKQTVATLIPEESLSGLSKFQGKLNWPVKGRVKESFGSVRGNGQMRWSGVLIAAKEGQDVKAIHHGRIVYSDYLRGFGLIIIIDHGDGYMSLYGHNEALFKQPGDWVEAGEQIATVGQSGGYPTTGLYFEIRLRSKALNPVKFVRRG